MSQTKQKNNVKEEFYLSVIFVVKWLTLGLGVIGILYLAIYLAYHKSYYDPLMEKYDLEIAELVKQRTSLNKSKNTLLNVLQANREKKNQQEKELLEISSLLEKTKHKKDELGLSVVDKAKMMLIGKPKNIHDLDQKLEKEQNAKDFIEKKIEETSEEIEKTNISINNISNNIGKISKDILEKKRDKKRAEVDIKGPLFWVAGILGLT